MLLASRNSRPANAPISSPSDIANTATTAALSSSMSGDTQSRHCSWLMLAVSLAHNADAGSGYVGHSRSVLSALPEAIRVPSGLNATLCTSGYVECAYGGFGEGCRKRYDFVPYIDLPDGWFTKDGNSYCSEHWTMVRRRVTTSKEVRHKRKKGRK